MGSTVAEQMSTNTLSVSGTIAFDKVRGQMASCTEISSCSIDNVLS
jgi:hypothetical protein